MWSIHCVDLRPVCWLARLLVSEKPSCPFHATQYVMLTYTFILLLQLKLLHELLYTFTYTS
jgi:hypothetical protein